jgi:hypothetical protein
MRLWFIEFLERRGWTYMGLQNRVYTFRRDKHILWIHTLKHRYTLLLNRSYMVIDV